MIQGDLYVVSAPSGAGKTSLVHALLQQTDNLVLSVSHTTRVQRPSERPGINYNFVTVEEFEQLIQQQAFFEYANVYGNYYGTTKKWVMEQLVTGHDVILEIDWQGARQVMQLYPPAISIFIFPPSREILLQRLQKRGQDDPEVIQKRMAVADIDIANAQYFSYWVINNDFTTAVTDLHAIIRSQRLRRDYQLSRNPLLLKDWDI